MDFKQSIKTCLVDKYVDFNGRASRSEYWYFFLLISILTIVADIIDASIAGVNYIDHMGYGPAWGVITVLTIIPCITVGVRRLHDINKSGWFMLLLLTGVGVFPIIYWSIQVSDKGANNYGEDHMETNGEGIFKPLHEKHLYLSLPILALLTMLGLYDMVIGLPA